MERRICALAIFLGFLLCASVAAQPGEKTPAPEKETPPPAPDIYGRSTPRGTVRGFLAAGRRGNYESAARYLNTPLSGEPAAKLAQKLFVVLDRRLPARVNQLSDRREGGLSYPNEPDRDLIGPVSSSTGEVEITVERPNRANADPVWLFSQKTLDAIPDLYEEVVREELANVVPRFLVDVKIAEVAIGGWLAVLLGIPLLLYVLGLLNRFFSAVERRVQARIPTDLNLTRIEILPTPLRVLLAALILRWAASQLRLPLMTRQFWSGIAVVLGVVGCVWLIMRLNAWGELHILRSFGRNNFTGAVSFLRFARGMINMLLIFAGVLVMLYRWGVDITAALTGLGVGGIAVALAAQKTLENVIGGVSLIFDRAVRVGDFLKVGDTIGTVQDVGLRSIQIRTLGRTLVNVPNGQIASMSLENMSLRDKFYFLHILALAYETTAPQIRTIVQELNRVLQQQRGVEADSVRVRFLRLGTSSLDLELQAYYFARDWPHFLQIQEELLLQVMDVVHAAGTRLALPSQMAYVATQRTPTQLAKGTLPRQSASRKDSAGGSEAGKVTQAAE